jgi:hypothetical protein
MKQIIELLSVSDYYGISDTIDTAKGRYQIPYTWKDAWKNIKRRLWQIRKSK